MLRKVISIKNVGRFFNYRAAGDVELRRYTLVFAENARGKTTICAILRSLQSGDPAYVIGRTTIGSQGAPEINILLASGTAVLNAGAWSTTVPNLAIFDSKFVSENVYSGDAVDLSHKRSLYGVIVGAQGVALARQIERYDTATREKSTEIREKLAFVQAIVPQGLTVENFLQLQEDPAIDYKIAEKGKELKAAQQAEEIRTRPALSELNLPKFWLTFEVLLGKTIEGIAEDAERRVSLHIEAHAIHDHGEPWLSEGLGYILNDKCPFCGQAITGVTLIAAYRDYFSEDYNALRTEITTLHQQISDAFSDRVIASIERIIDQNKAGIEFWSRFCTTTPPVLDVGVSEALINLRNAALPLLERKAATPLEHVSIDAPFTVALDAFMAAIRGAETYNQAVRAANVVIAQKKDATGTVDVIVVERDLTLLQAIKKRYEPEAKEACNKYMAALTEKKTIEQEKDRVKVRLDEHTREVIGLYENTINDLLEGFHAGFRITGTNHGYPGGVASASYKILINETPVELGDSNSPISRPSFKNTLSSGDKSTLALAFFLSRIEHDPEKTSKIVIFDDPFNSQDNFRKECTVQRIKECGEDCQQVLVLSHDQSFLKRIWDRLATRASDRKCLKLRRVGERDTKICDWNIEEAMQSPFVADRKLLAAYYTSGEGSPRDIVVKIRPLLETYCRSLYPGDFDEDALGTIIRKIRANGPLHQIFPLLEKLDSLNEYGRRYHHGENPNAAIEPIDDNELHGFVKKTLSIIGYC
ncbi:MAG: hypothetical protein FJ128_11120 [Deltaproteobacteria bacterium]|nr:hypothetical protein [Deltaproteobacteria bacterium]